MNSTFLSKYGKHNFESICSIIPEKLLILKSNKKIKSYKLSNRKKSATIYKNHTSRTLDYATIYLLDDDKLLELFSVDN